MGVLAIRQDRLLCSTPRLLSRDLRLLGRRNFPTALSYAPSLFYIRESTQGVFLYLLSILLYRFY